ncbi:MAG TPA: SUMF1/EgtB/PvdO family nonheme iron enzyme [Acidimicrobiales bacterium]
MPGLVEATAMVEPGARLRLPARANLGRYAYLIAAGDDRAACSAAAPTLLRSQVLSSLYRAVRRGETTEREEDERLAYVWSLGLRRPPPPARSPAAGRRRARSRTARPVVDTVATFQDAPDAPPMVAVPAGTFPMGSPPDEPQRSVGDVEGPRHAVRIRRPFAIGRDAVTVAEFTAFVDDSGHEVPDVLLTGEYGHWAVRDRRSFRDPGFPQDGSHPAVGLNWLDADAYARWLAERTGRPYRLPSEAEWEYAARAGTTTRYWWGHRITADDANYDGDRGGTVPVGSFRPNPWGLYQVSGNVWEWCADTWVAGYGTGPVDERPRRVEGEPSRVLRGGSWLNGPWNVRSAMRLGDPEGFRHPTFGVRVAVDLPAGDGG